MQQVNQQELQHLITVSTGFIDIYVIQCFGQPPMLVPQNIVLSALDSLTTVKQVDWHQSQLPVYAVHDPTFQKGVALVIEGEKAHQRFAFMCNEMPKTMRLRISEVVDDIAPLEQSLAYQYVRVGDEQYQVPNLSYIERLLGL